MDKVGDSIGLGAKLDNAVAVRNVSNLTTKLVAKRGDGLQMRMLVAESLGGGDAVGVVALGVARSSRLGGRRRWHSILVNLAMVFKELLKELGTKERDLGKEKLTLNKRRIGVVKNGPNGDKILDLSASLLDNAVKAMQNNSHTRKILDLGVGHNKRVNVETTSSKGTGDSRKDTRLVLNKTVEHMGLACSGHSSDRGFVQDRRDGRVGRPVRSINGRERRSLGVAVKGLVGHRRDGRIGASAADLSSDATQDLLGHCGVGEHSR